MSTTSSIESFVDVLKRSGLLDEATVASRLAQFQSNDAPQTAQAFSEFLVKEQAINSWQAGKLLQGKHKGFFLGKYKLLKLLGRGGMSSVYLAEHVRLRRQCAIKVLPAKLVNDGTRLERFLREARAVASLDHPHIVRAYDVDEERDGSLEIHFLVMEYVEGRNLFDLVHRTGPVSPVTAADYIRQGALGLAHAHQAGMVHRDVKPGNLIVDRNGVVKVMDLGLARVPQDENETSLTMAHGRKVLGTADYLAPEQALDSHLVDARADIYGLGCTFYFLLTGHPPFHEGTLAQRLLAHQSAQPPALTQFRSDVPESLARIIEAMLIKDRNARTQTAAEVVSLLTDWLNNPGAQLSAAGVELLPSIGPAAGAFDSGTAPGDPEFDSWPGLPAVMPTSRPLESHPELEDFFSKLSSEEFVQPPQPAAVKSRAIKKNHRVTDTEQSDFTLPLWPKGTETVSVGTAHGDSAVIEQLTFPVLADVPTPSAAEPKRTPNPNGRRVQILVAVGLGAGVVAVLGILIMVAMWLSRS